MPDYTSAPVNGHTFASSFASAEAVPKVEDNHEASMTHHFPSAKPESEPSMAPLVPPTAEPISSVGIQPAAMVSDAHPQAQHDSSQLVSQHRSNDTKPYDGPMQITAAQLKFAQATLKSLRSRREAIAFLAPVDPVALGIPHYPQIISKPMDFGTIDIKLALTALVLKPNSKPGEKAKSAHQWGLDPSRDVYRRMHDFEADVRQVFFNCATFNGPDSPYTQNARVLEAAFDKYMKDVPIEAPSTPQVTDPTAARARRPSNPVPTIRRSSSDVGGRPKREIHPPPPKDLPWANEPQSASSSDIRKAARRKMAKKARSMSAREQAHYAKVAQDELRFCTRIIDDLLKPTYSNVAWVFYDKPTMDFDWAPAYFQMIKKPIALRDVQKNIRAGEYADADEFNAGMQLLFQNCFTFNPPGSDVYKMGEQLKAVYEEKFAKKPAPAPLPDYEESEVDEDDEEDEEDEVDPDFLATLQAQISQLSATLAVLEGAKNQNADLIANTKNMLASLQESYASSGGSKKSKVKGAGTKRKASESGGASKKKSKAKSASSPSAAAAEYIPAKKTKSAGAAKKKPAPNTKKAATSSRRDDNSDEDIRTVTYEQKEELAAKITELSEERLDGAIRIINEDKPPNQNDEEEIELDIDELSPRTLYKLYKYVVRPKKVAPPVNKNSKSAPLDGRKRGTGGIKKKNLDEGEEAERIARLQQQLEQFGNPDAVGSGGGAAGGHDDLVHSESSSDESGSDSDSD
ncbi:related to BDF1 - sporulation protein [Melanopsichium pennsylvanicum]|uniref:Related to BDF1 - sporulation protein n=2 Tax=Melanopsichium pennsylvanicum TaxID=63383 RepID=A0AAJ4XQ96_9BASI|nr:related to BDF1-sporulation protein [Melanopsichium pennsylvanicum 4]SNX85917.1 related to BDF1 - sporulation protein [Melanopsichium pennsylvanicum]